MTFKIFVALCLATSDAAIKDCHKESDKRHKVEEELEALKHVALTWDRMCGLSKEYLNWCKTQPERIVQLWGERHSATNLAMQILRHNFKLATVSRAKDGDVYPYKFKHALALHPGNEPEFELPLHKALRDNATHVVMVRYPLGWIQSMWRLPHNDINLVNVSFDDFVHSAWPFEEAFIKGNIAPLQRPPTAYPSHENIMKMRDFKLNFFMERLKEYNVDTADVDPLNSVSVLFVHAESLFLDAGIGVACDFATKLKLCPIHDRLQPELVDVSPGTAGTVFAPPTKEQFNETLSYWLQNREIVDHIESQLNWTLEYDLLRFPTFDQILQARDEAFIFGIV